MLQIAQSDTNAIAQWRRTLEGHIDCVSEQNEAEAKHSLAELCDRTLGDIQISKRRLVEFLTANASEDETWESAAIRSVHTLWTQQENLLMQARSHALADGSLFS